MKTLPPANCPRCGALLEPRRYFGPPQTATCYSDCLRQCSSCGIGLSNAEDPKRITVIHRYPLDNVPEQIRDGAGDTLVHAINLKSRSEKIRKFAFGSSEDALTWTVFKYLHGKRQLGKVMRALGVVEGDSVSEPALLLWGVPVPINDATGSELRRHLIRASDDVGEDQNLRTEPDVILDFAAAGLVIIEVKYGSPNYDSLRADAWSKYTEGTSAFSKLGEIAEGKGLYQLARNWRIGWELAGKHPFTLINLGPDRLFAGDEDKGLSTFEDCLNSSEKKRFVRLKWSELLAKITQDRWFAEHIERLDPAAGGRKRGVS